MKQARNVAKKHKPGEAKNSGKKDDLNKFERLQKGHIHARVIIEMMGKPKEYVEKLLKDYMKVLDEDERFEIKSKEFEVPTETEDKLFTTFCEAELWVKQLDSLVELCIDYMPSSIEIIEPEEFRFQASRFSNFLNDMQAKLHQLDMVAKTLDKQNQNLRVNATQLLKNLALFAVKDQPKTTEELSKIMGIPANDLEHILHPLIKEKLIKKEGEVFSRVK